MQAMKTEPMRNRMGWKVAACGLRRIVLGAGLMLAALGSAPQAMANPFDAVLAVNDRVITQYELDQRQLFLEILRQQGDLPQLARSGLIEDRLRLFAAEEAGMKIGPEQVLAGMEEFAGRANLTTDEFLQLTGEMGLASETFRDFVEAGMIWREVVRAKYAAGVTITEAEIDRAIANFQPTGASRLQLLELVLPGENGDLSGAQALARRLQVQIETEADFAAFARSNSAGETAVSGGRIGWQRLSELPEASRAALARLAPGSMSRPVLLEDRVVIYWLVERGEDPLGKAEGIWVDYAQFLVPEGANAEAELAAARAKADTCDDLYTVAAGLPEDRLLRESQPQSAVGGDIGAVLATLDAGETSTRLSRNGWRVLVMLCSRGPAPDLQPDRDVVREQLLNQRLSALADIYLEELRSEAIITEK
jgi:peptidyl-prolyl cis-trans isomerase SurA